MTYELNNEYINIKDNWWHFLTNDMGRIGAMWLVFWLRGLEPRVDGDDLRGMEAGPKLSSDTMSMSPQHTPYVTTIQSRIQPKLLPQGWDGGISRSWLAQPSIEPLVASFQLV